MTRHTACHWCLSRAHPVERCPVKPQPRRSTTDVNDALAERVHRWRLLAGQYRRLLREACLPIPPEIDAFNPDQP
jgi:hypothetical protein